MLSTGQIPSADAHALEMNPLVDHLVAYSSYRIDRLDQYHAKISHKQVENVSNLWDILKHLMLEQCLQEIDF